MLTLFKKKNTVHEYHTSCETISLYAFYQHGKTKDYRWLVVDWNEKDDIKIDEETARDSWNKIFEHYLKLKNDNRMIMIFQTQGELMYYQTRHTMIRTLLEVMVSRPMTEKELEQCYQALENWDVRIDRKKSLYKIVKSISLYLRRAINKINILQTTLKELNGEEEDREEVALTKLVFKMEQALSREIDARKITVEKWIYMFEYLDEISKTRKNG